MKNHHFICEVFDTINNDLLVMNRYTDTTTINKAVQHFRKLPEIKKYLNKSRYKVIMKINSVDLNYNKYSGYNEGVNYGNK